MPSSLPPPHPASSTQSNSPPTNRLTVSVCHLPEEGMATPEPQGGDTRGRLSDGDWGLHECRRGDSNAPSQRHYLRQTRHGHPTQLGTYSAGQATRRRYRRRSSCDCARAANKCRCGGGPVESVSIPATWSPPNLSSQHPVAECLQTPLPPLYINRSRFDPNL